MFVFPEMPQFSHLIPKMGHFRKNEHKKGAFREKKARDRFENGKSTEIEYVRFWDISGKMHMSSRAKYILHIHFGAFKETSRITTPSIENVLNIGMVPMASHCIYFCLNFEF